MMIDCRCESHLHFRFDPERTMVSIKCRWCSSKYQRPVFHSWPLLEIADRVRRGEVVGTCEPESPRFVHWLVKSAA